MTDEAQRGSNSVRAVTLLAGTGIGVLQLNGVFAAEPAADATPNRDALEEVYVFGRRDAYKLDTSSLLKLPLPLIDIPQSINTVSAQEMQDRAVMDLNTALHSVPGVTIGAGEFRSIGTSPTIRGFVARTDMFMDGIRDYGDYYRDPLQSRGRRSPRRTVRRRVRPRFDRRRDRAGQQTAGVAAAHRRNTHRRNRWHAARNDRRQRTADGAW